MNTNRISFIIPEEVIAEITTGLNQVRALLQPYLQDLTIEERHDLPKMSDRSYSFISKVNDYCSDNPEFCPSYLNPAELNKDFETVAALKPVFALCEQLCNNVDDTMLLAGSEAYTGALVYYGSVQMAAKTGQGNAKPIFEDLNRRFAGIGRRTKSTPTTV